MTALSHMLRVAFATSRDQRWRLSSWMLPSSYKPLSFQGKIYVLHNPTFSGETKVFQIDQPHYPSRMRWAQVRLGCCHQLRDPVIGPSDSRLADLILERTVPVTWIGGNALH